MMLSVFIAALVVALLAQWHVKRAYARHSRTPTLRGYSGAEVAKQILREAGITQVEIIEHDELLGLYPKRRRTRRRESGTERGSLDLRSGVHLFAGLFPFGTCSRC
jgi:Zn-dependent membrane protease YugP